MAKDVKFTIKLNIDGKEQVVTASTNVKELAEQLDIAKTRGDDLRDALLVATQVTQSFQSAINGMRQISGLMSEYTDAYTVQQEAETKLANNMRNTMGARDEDIQSIKDLCAAQQELGVIGDEVQLAGAQELATYLEKKSSLETLIPVMNDMVAQQYGLNATQESAANIATMLGKVMDGQVGALSRYGYKFDEAQEQILKFGTEEERAAVLAEVVESAVGGMNAELAKTDAGKAKQAANAFGDLKERIGEIFAPLQASIIKAGQLALAINGIGTTLGGIWGIVKAFRTFYATLKTTEIGAKLAGAATKWHAMQLKLQRDWALGSALGMRAAAIQANALTIALKGLQMVTIIGAAFVALTTILSLFSSKTDEATEAMSRAEVEAKRVKELEEAEAQAYTNTSATLNIYKQKLKDLIAQKATGKDVTKEEKKIVGELNDTYGDTMGYFENVSKWYDALIANSEAYCRQMVLEARTRTLANQIAAKEQEQHDIQKKIDNKEYSTQREYEQEKVSIQSYHMGLQGGTRPTSREIPGTSELDKAEKQIEDLKDDVADLTKQMQDAVKEASQLDFSVKGSTTRPQGDGGNGGKSGKTAKLIADPKTLDELRTNIDLTKKKLTDADTAEQRQLREQIKLWQQKADAIELSQKKAALPAGVISDTGRVDVTKIETEADVKAVTDYLNALKKVAATKKELSDIDAQIAVVELRQAELLRPDTGILQSLLGNANDETITVNVEQGSVDLPEVPADDKVIKVNVEQGEVNLPQIPADDKLIKVNVEQGEVNLPEIPANDETITVNVEQGSVDLSPLQVLQAIDKELNYQRALRKTATAEQQKQIDDIINRLETLKSYTKDAGVISMDNSALQNYDQLNTKLSFYRDLLKTALPSARPAILQHIKDLEEIESRWQKADKAATINVNPADLSTLKEISEAIAHLQERQQSESGLQIQATQIDISKLQEKQKAIQLSVEIPSMQKEVEEIQALTGREYRLKIKGMGFDSLIDKVRELNKTLNNPNLGKEQRAQLMRLRDSYADFAKDAAQSFSTYRQGWEGIKGIGNGIQSISDALDGNGNAWQKTTAIIDGFLQICDGISAVVEMVQMLTMATNLQTAAKTTEMTATTANTAAIGSETAATAANTAAAAANTAVKCGEAIAGATSSGASMPFPYNLIAIAAGVAAVIAAIAAIASFETGGVVGGNSPTGDRVLARVNSGEMILNKRQQQRLLYILNGGALSAGLTPVMPKPQKVDLNVTALQSQLQPVDIHVHGSLKGRGRDLLATIENEQNHNKRS